MIVLWFWNTKLRLPSSGGGGQGERRKSWTRSEYKDSVESLEHIGGDKSAVA